MKRRIERPRILLLDCSLEYKKGENQTNVEITKEEDWATLLKIKEDWIGDVREDCGVQARRRRHGERVQRSRVSLPRQGWHHRVASRAQDG